MNKSFALARICIDEIGGSPYIDFGLNSIYNLFQDEKTVKELLENYNYTKNDFTKETGSLDVFNSVDIDLIQTSSVYFVSDGEIYSENRKLSTQTLIKQSGDFEILFSNLNENVTCIRIDPDEGAYRWYSDIHIFINGNEVDFSSNNTFIDDNKVFFLHKDPIFYIYFNGEVNDIYIVGKTKKISIDDIVKYYQITIDKIIMENKFKFKVKNRFNFYLNKLKCISKR